MGIDRKYGKVTTEFGNIGEDEPVVVFRAQDILLQSLLAYYSFLCMKAGSPKRHLDIIFNTATAVLEWQTKNVELVRVPNSESSKDRLEE